FKEVALPNIGGRDLAGMTRSGAAGAGQSRRLDVGDRRIGIRLEYHLLPGGRVRQQRPQQPIVERVSGFMAAELSDQAVSQQIEIPDRIQDLVLDEPVLVPEATPVEHPEIIEHNGVVEIAAEREIT